jgi:hypothetical protein
VAGDEDGVVEAGFLDQLDALAQLSDPRNRGRPLERVVADLFRQHHFFVTINPGVARPRQTDVFAPRAGQWRREFARRGVTIHQADCLIAAATAGIEARLATGNPSDFPMDEVTVDHRPVGT